MKDVTDSNLTLADATMALLSLLRDDPDGLWSSLDDQFPDLGIDISDVVALCEREMTIKEFVELYE